MTNYPYISGWCGTGEHLSCAGTYAGTACRCRCHHPRRRNPSGVVQPSLFTVSEMPPADLDPVDVDTQPARIWKDAV